MNRIVVASVVALVLLTWCFVETTARAGQSDRVTHLIILEELRPYQLSKEETAWITVAENRAKSLELEARELRDKAQTRYGLKGHRPADRQRMVSDALSKEREADRLRETLRNLKRDAGSAYWMLGWDGVRDIMVYVPPKQAKGLKQLSHGNLCSVTGNIIEVAVGAAQQFQTLDCIKWERDEKQRPPDTRPPERTPIWDAHITTDDQGRRQVTPSLYPRRPLPRSVNP